MPVESGSSCTCGRRPSPGQRRHWMARSPWEWWCHARSEELSSATGSSADSGPCSAHASTRCLRGACSSSARYRRPVRHLRRRSPRTWTARCARSYGHGAVGRERPAFQRQRRLGGRDDLYSLARWPGSGVPAACFSPPWSAVPLLPVMLVLRGRGSGQARCAEGNLAGGPSVGPLPSVEPWWRRSRTAAHSGGRRSRCPGSNG